MNVLYLMTVALSNAATGGSAATQYHLGLQAQCRAGRLVTTLVHFANRLPTFVQHTGSVFRIIPAPIEVACLSSNFHHVCASHRDVTLGKKVPRRIQPEWQEK
jgi:hypothetical protein